MKTVEEMYKLSDKSGIDLGKEKERGKMPERQLVVEAAQLKRNYY